MSTVATTDQKARAFDLFTGVMELTHNGNRDIRGVCRVLQIIKEDLNFLQRLTGTGDGNQLPTFFRETGELVIEIPALPRPTLAELRMKYGWIHKENGIARDISPTGAVTLKLGTVLLPRESSIGGSQYTWRCLEPEFPIALGYQQAVWAVENQDRFPALMALLGKVYIDLRGIEVVDADGGRGFPCLGRDGERWFVHWDWTGRDLDSNGRLAVSGKQQIRFERP